ncbi:MAG: PIG-L deacetylase family protein [Anaerolineae bacterium]
MSSFKKGEERMSVTKPVLLAVLARPDDESFGMGGPLALYAQRGADVYLVCATRGEVGSVDAEHLHNYPSITALREAELRCAAQTLGLKGVFFLDYRDSGMPGSPENQYPEAQINHPVEEVAGRVVRYIRQLKPDVVLTFDPIGGYRHPAHIHIHQATVLAFERSANLLLKKYHNCEDLVVRHLCRFRLRNEFRVINSRKFDAKENRALLQIESNLERLARNKHQTANLGGNHFVLSIV